MADGLAISGSGSGISAGKASSSSASEDLPVQEYALVFEDGAPHNNVEDVIPKEIAIRFTCDAHGESDVLKFELDQSKKVNLSGGFRCDVVFGVKDVTPASCKRKDLVVQIRVTGKVTAGLRLAECVFNGTVWGTVVPIQIDGDGGWTMEERDYLAIEPANYQELLRGESSSSPSAQMKSESGSSFDTEKSFASGNKEEAETFSDQSTLRFLKTEPVYQQPPTALESSTDSDAQSDAGSRLPVPLADRLSSVSSVKLRLIAL